MMTIRCVDLAADFAITDNFFAATGVLLLCNSLSLPPPSMQEVVAGQLVLEDVVQVVQDLASAVLSVLAEDRACCPLTCPSRTGSPRRLGPSHSAVQLELELALAALLSRGLLDEVEQVVPLLVSPRMHSSKLSPISCGCASSMSWSRVSMLSCCPPSRG